MTLSDIARIPSDVLTPAQVAPFIGCDPHTIRVAAHDAPELLGFPVIVMGTRVRIPKNPFVQYFRGKESSPCE